MFQSRPTGLRMLFIVFAVIYIAVCYFAYTSLSDQKDAELRTNSNRYHPRGSQLDNDLFQAEFKQRTDAKLEELRKRLNNSLAELLDINSDLKKRIIPPKSIIKPVVSKAETSTQKVKVALHPEAEMAKRRQFVSDMMKHAWQGYVEHAWGQSEVKPDTLRGHNAAIFGSAALGATIVDALDTLYVMDMKEEFARARKWVAESLNFETMRSEVSVFEFTIRYLGGLLSAYALSHDEVFLKKSKELADLLLPAFATSSGIPYSLLNFHTKETRNYNWANSACSILAEVGTLHMEFAYLSRLTGEPVYENKVQKIRALLNKQPKVNGLYRNYINPLDGSWCGDDTSVGALGDSFYEYLLKDWLRTGRSNAELRNMFDEAVEGIRSQLSQRSASGFFYFGEMRNGAVQQRVDHLSCFFGGTLALGAQDVVSKDYRKAWFNDAVEFTRTCHESYVRTATHLGPDTFYLTSGDEFSTQTPNERAYLQRPEVIESYFYLWRLTHNETYREWAWDAALAIEKHCRAKGGYSGLRDVYTAGATHDDVQQSYFLAETLKYLYLIFSPDTVIPLNKWVFNTEAHPFPVEA